MSGIDRLVSGLARALARRASRRGFLARLGVLLVGASALPLLPIARSARAAGAPAPGEPDPATPEGDPRDCAYWRNCAIDGFLAACCGGTHASCPPGTQMSPITWIGTCRNPADGRNYAISYNDCCGKNTCGRCYCQRTEGDRPVYVPARANDIDWCMGSAGVVYNSTVVLVLGVAGEGEAR